MKLTLRGRYIAWIAVACFVGACASTPTIGERQTEAWESYRASVRASVPDPDRADRLVALGERLQGDLTEYLVAVGRCYDRLAELNADYDTSREELEAAYAAMNETRRKIRARLLATRGEVKALTTADEWRALMRREKRIEYLLRNQPDWMR